MVVPISVSSFATYWPICSSVRPRWRVSLSFFMSSEARSTGGTLTSVTWNTIHSLGPAPAVCRTPALAVRNAALIALAGTPGSEASRRNPLAVSTFDPTAAALFELLDHLRCLGPQPACDLVIAPSRLDLILHLV